MSANEVMSTNDVMSTNEVMSLQFVMSDIIYSPWTEVFVMFDFLLYISCKTTLFQKNIL